METRRFGLWVERLGWMIAGAVISLAISSAIGIYFELQAKDSIGPGSHFPVVWLVRAGFTEDEVKHYRTIEQAHQSTSRAFEKMHFSKWLIKNKIPFTDEQIDAITQTK